MNRAFRRVAVLGILGAGVLTSYHLAAGAAARVASTGDDLQEPGGVAEMFRQMTALGSGYHLSALKNLTYSDDQIGLKYVDPERIDYPAMYRAALDAVERQVPQVLLRLDSDGTKLHAQVGNYSTVLTVQKLTNGATLEAELKRVAAILEEHLDDKDVKHEDVEAAMINGMLGTLDPHSVFLPPENAKKMEEDNEGEFGGLGITIVMRDNLLTVDYPLEDTPAYRAGIQADDQITRIEGESTLNMDLDEAVGKMRGAPGSPVTITVSRKGWTAPKDFTIVRDRIKATKVKGELLDGGVAWVRIDSFHEQVETQLDEVLTKLSRDAGPSGLKGLVLDMRDNPGGYLHQAVAVADKFLDHGVIVSTVERAGGAREEKVAKESGTEPAYPMAVLMTGNSASAAEIVAGALKNQERAVIIGERSFGKGSVQNLYSLSDNSRLKLTVARYLTPGDHSIQNIGIPPDIELKATTVLPPKEIEIEEGGVKRNVTTGPLVSFFNRERLQREADLPGHLKHDEDLETPPVYGLRYLAPARDDSGPKTDRKDPREDFQIMFARDVLLASHGSRRADVLRDASTVVAARTKAEATRIEQAFKAPGVGIDWSSCVNPEHANVKMDLQLGTDGVLDAGQMEDVRLTVTNQDTKPLCQAAAVSKSGNDALDGLEFYLGKVPAGESRSYVTKVRLSDGYPTEISNMDLTLVDAARKELATAAIPVRTQGGALPHYAWSWSFSDAAPGGDGDGLVEVGETVTMNVDVKNTGPGPGGVARFELKKGADVGKAVELKNGSIEFPTLAPGAHATGQLSFLVAKAPATGDALTLEMRVRDAERWDYASIIKGEFYAYYNQTATIPLTLGQTAAPGSRVPPSITISRAPGSSTTDGDVTISGVAADDVGIRDVIVYHGAQKIAYVGGGDGTPLTSVPFTANTSLAEGNNLLVVLVRDTNGLTATQAVDVFRGPAGPATAAGDKPAAPKTP